MLSDREYMRYQTFRPGTPKIVLALIVINVVIYLLQQIVPDLEFYLALEPWIVIRNLQVWRLVTYAFLHANFSHILFNMYAIWLYGRLLGIALGPKRFLTLYLSSSILGGLLWVLCNLNAPGPVFCVGASAAAFGLMVAAAMAFPRLQFFLLFPPIPIRLWVLTLVYCLIEIFALLNINSNVAHLAHLGGAFAGFFYMCHLGCTGFLPAFLRRLFERKPRAQYQYRRPSSSGEQPRGGEPTSAEIDQILDRISQVGYSNLTEEEREVLRRASDTLRSRQNGD